MQVEQIKSILCRPSIDLGLDVRLDLKDLRLDSGLQSWRHDVADISVIASVGALNFMRTKF